MEGSLAAVVVDGQRYKLYLLITVTTFESSRRVR